MEYLIDIGISALLRMLKSKKEIDKWSRAIAKVYVTIHRAAQSYEPLQKAIEAKEAEVGGA
jgi:hypothetical protein